MTRIIFTHHCVAAMKRGKHVLMHKPLANRLQEARLVIETARKTRVARIFCPPVMAQTFALSRRN